jgi:hypothetical protein
MNKLGKITAVSTAALLAASAGAMAQDKAKASKPSISVGGYMDQKFTVHNYDSAYEAAAGKTANFDQRNDTEVYILGSVQLDNGIKIKTRVELEGFTINDTGDAANFANGTSSQPDMVDEAYMDISGSFGAVRVGSTDLAGKRMTTGHQATFFMNVGENTRFNITKVIPKPSTVSNSVVSQMDLSSDGESVSYVSPRWNGFVVGFGWAATANEDYDGATLKSAADNDIFDAAINWVGKFGDVGISLNAGYTGAKSKTAGNSDPSQWALGGRLTMGGLAIGLSTQHNESSTAAGVSTEEDIIEAGVRYVMGPNAFSIVGAWSEMGGNVAASKDDETKAYSIAYRRTLGPGVTWHNTLHIADYNDGLAGAAASNSNDGYALTTGIKISF